MLNFICAHMTGGRALQTDGRRSTHFVEEDTYKDRVRTNAQIASKGTVSDDAFSYRRHSKPKSRVIPKGIVFDDPDVYRDMGEAVAMDPKGAEKDTGAGVNFGDQSQDAGANCETQMQSAGPISGRQQRGAQERLSAVVVREGILPGLLSTCDHFEIEEERDCHLHGGGPSASDRGKMLSEPAEKGVVRRGWNR